MFFFFFQAEDGIRDRNVTGVQTCALPIWSRSLASASSRMDLAARSDGRSRQERKPCIVLEALTAVPRMRMPRSEERRVGKEGRSGRTTRYEKERTSERQGEGRDRQDNAHG